jgi:hypothetical protein
MSSFEPELMQNKAAEYKHVAETLRYVDIDDYLSVARRLVRKDELELRPASRVSSTYHRIPIRESNSQNLRKSHDFLT